MRRFTLCALSLLIPSFLCAFAQQEAVLVKKANLRKDPSATHPAIAILLVDQEVDVLDAATNPRWVKVRTDDKKTGWVIKTAVKVLPDTPPPPVATTPGNNPPTTGGGTTPASAIDPTWTKQKPVSVAYSGSEGSCPAGGAGGDTPTNLLKNRSDEPAEIHDVQWSAIMDLKYPDAPTMRSKWTQAQLAQITPFEGVAVRTVGFLAHNAKVEDGGTGESTNCKFLDGDDVDWHIYLAQQSADTSIGKTVIVETTPRFRKNRNWDFTVMERFVGQGPVRISGFLMLDPEHRSQVGTARGTVWEIHPVTKIEVCDKASCAEGEWKDLSGLK
jgi:hypothetical protein